MFAISGANGLEEAAERLNLEVQLNPTLSAQGATQIVRIFLQSKKTSEKLMTEAKAYSGQSPSSGSSHMLVESINREANAVTTSKRFGKDNKKRKTKEESSEYEFPFHVYKYYVRFFQ